MSNKCLRPHHDARFALHQRQPRADKLDAQQRRLCKADAAFEEALRARVSSGARFSAFLDGASYYVDLEHACAKCGSGKKRTRDRSCYGCHLARGRPNFERIKAGLASEVARNKDGHLDLLERQRAEREGDCETRDFGSITVTRWPTGRLEVLFPDGYRELDLAKPSGQHVHRLIGELPELKDALMWAGWY
jgi:hypothetical protein